MIPQHCGMPMYMDTWNGVYMKRWLCQNPGCMACISEEILLRTVIAPSGEEIQIPVPSNVVELFRT